MMNDNDFRDCLKEEVQKWLKYSSNPVARNLLSPDVIIKNIKIGDNLVDTTRELSNDEVDMLVKSLSELEDSFRNTIDTIGKVGEDLSRIESINFIKHMISNMYFNTNEAIMDVKGISNKDMKYFRGEGTATINLVLTIPDETLEGKVDFEFIKEGDRLEKVKIKQVLYNNTEQTTVD